MDRRELADNHPELLNLYDGLHQLHSVLRVTTKSKYNRINPFVEDLFDWKERGVFWAESDKNITIYNSTIINGNVKIGNNTWVGPFCSLDGGLTSLEIGEFCSISTGCQIVTHDSVKWALSGGKLPYEYAPTKIGNYCFIGSHAVITKGVTVGDHCLIGAGAVVVHDIPSYSIAAGVPAKIIGHVKILEDGKVELSYSPANQ